MILSDRDIRKKMKEGRIKITPEPEDVQIQPSSIDLGLSNDFIIPTPMGNTKVEVFDTLILQPGDSLLGSTIEYIELSDSLCARVEGRSSLGRKFLNIHSTAGFADSGFKGNITLEFTNNGKEGIELRKGMRICQLVFEELSSPAERPYGSEGLNSKYQGQKGVTESKLEE